MITLTIDGHEVQVKEGRTILEAARQHGLGTIPTLCYHEALAPFAACRMCLVELENRRNGALAPACAYPCEEGLIVHTDSEKVRRSRRMTIELLMASAAHVPLIRAMAGDLGVEAPRYSTEQDRCILCGLCVRASATVDGKNVFAIDGHGIATRLIVNSPSGLLGDSALQVDDCAAHICPVGALLPKRRGFATPIGQRRFDISPVSQQVEKDAT